MMQASFEKRTFYFKRPSGTSRGVLKEKYAWFITIWHSEKPGIKGIGECSVIPGLSPDFIDFESYESKLANVCADLDQDLTEWPSIKFGVESALLDLKNGGTGRIFENAFSRGDLKIPINGLVWMGEKSFMQEQIDTLLDKGFKTIKMKIGAIDFQEELELLHYIRTKYSADEITLRVDANGAFTPKQALEKLNALSEFAIHSIEQPIMAGQISELADLCKNSPISIALDEELIGINTFEEKTDLLATIKPAYIILKPSLHGGISGTKEWIEIAESQNIDWWMTSALESNIGLNAICQLTAEYNNPLPHGLGTGSLYTNNVPSSLQVENGMIFLTN